MHDPFRNHLDRIDDLYAFIACDAQGNEGLPAVTLGNVAYPLVGADPQRVESLKLLAQEVANASGQTLTLYRFRGRETLLTVGPQPKK